MSDRQEQLEAEVLGLKRRVRRLTAMNVVIAAMALGVSGAGAAYALAAANTVNSASIIDGTIITPDLKTGALSGSKILDNAVTGTDVNESTLVLTCAAGLTKLGGFCYGSESEIASAQGDARIACRDLKLRLPSISEAEAIASELSDDSFDWTDITFAADSQLKGVAIATDAQAFGIDVGDPTNTNRFRCVTSVGARP